VGASKCTKLPRLAVTQKEGSVEKESLIMIEGPYGDDLANCKNDLLHLMRYLQGDQDNAMFAQLFGGGDRRVRERDKNLPFRWSDLIRKDLDVRCKFKSSM